MRSTRSLDRNGLFIISFFFHSILFSALFIFDPWFTNEPSLSRLQQKGQGCTLLHRTARALIPAVRSDLRPQESLPISPNSRRHSRPPPLLLALTQVSTASAAPIATTASTQVLRDTATTSSAKAPALSATASSIIPSTSPSPTVPQEEEEED